MRSLQESRTLLNSGRWWSIAFGFACTGAGLGALHLLATPKGFGIFRAIIGSDKRYSTSLAQLAIWTVAIVTGLGFLLGRSMFESETFDKLIPADRWNQYLLLLGGPFAAAVLARGVVTYKLAAGTIQKSEPTSTTGSQVVKNDKGSTDLVDAQYLLFNVVALGYFVIQIVKTSQLPEIPSTLLALTGATAATYVANKAAQKNAPTITSVSPATVETGGTIVVYGTNFDPGDRNDDRRRVTLQLSEYTGDIYAFDSSDTRARFRVPAAAKAGDQTITLTSTAGAQTEPHDIHVRAKEALVTETNSQRGLRPGSTTAVRGQHLGEPTDTVIVKLGTMSVTGTPKKNGDELEFQVPNPLPDPTASTIKATISVPGQADLVRKFPIDQPTIRNAWREDDKVRLHADGLVPPGEALDPQPRVLVNDWAVTATVARGVDYELALPNNVDVTGELKIVVFDDLGRKSTEYTVAAKPGGPPVTSGDAN